MTRPIDALREELSETYKSAGNIAQERNQLRAENLQMRKALENIYTDDPSFKRRDEICLEALNLPHTSRLAKRIALMERVLGVSKELRFYCMGTDASTQHMTERFDTARKELDALDQEGG